MRIRFLGFALLFGLSLFSSPCEGDGDGIPAITNVEERKKAPYEDMLHWAISQSDPASLTAKMEDYKRRNANISELMTPEVREALFPVDEASEMVRIISLLSETDTAEKDPVEAERVIMILEEYVQQVDNAMNLHKMGGLTVLLRLLLSETGAYNVRVAAAWCLGTAAQNNDVVQEQLLSLGAVDGIVRLAVSRVGAAIRALSVPSSSSEGVAASEDLPLLQALPERAREEVESLLIQYDQALALQVNASTGVGVHTPAQRAELRRAAAADLAAEVALWEGDFVSKLLFCTSALIRNSKAGAQIADSDGLFRVLVDSVVGAAPAAVKAAVQGETGRDRELRLKVVGGLVKKGLALLQTAAVQFPDLSWIDELMGRSGEDSLGLRVLSLLESLGSRSKILLESSEDSEGVLSASSRASSGGLDFDLVEKSLSLLSAAVVASKGRGGEGEESAAEMEVLFGKGQGRDLVQEGKEVTGRENDGEIVELKRRFLSGLSLILSPCTGGGVSDFDEEGSVGGAGMKVIHVDADADLCSPLVHHWDSVLSLSGLVSSSDIGRARDRWRAHLHRLAASSFEGSSESESSDEEENLENREGKVQGTKVLQIGPPSSKDEL
uniref:Nucleotide exchange factor Fes1 domain-containing protein n=1 Tax=Chromera velia CCMP2878 TaxID=1169474 RepID=A0A0G4I3P3_9ALVE|eukprot:Cvel_10652.t1-p1 / transcript=Cvel_10652.t1 / gene=Cvel_10652 / organism=Chromera_velia_CCMP2878 / gene_product=Hsp70 nucleotide exchange factor fes1, putative / transcript_product=Hsp70 nucleotide exchange factor fes1, putative / location=Cvel_scaffold647:43343-45172(+) / protein_length=610 / sequence_SO=supercontig / SO=protein_coding / is_pseudo=false